MRVITANSSVDTTLVTPTQVRLSGAIVIGGAL